MTILGRLLSCALDHWQASQLQQDNKDTQEQANGIKAYVAPVAAAVCFFGTLAFSYR